MVTAEGLTTKSFIYCIDCKTYADYWKYDNLTDAGHGDCQWRYVTEEEFAMLKADCLETTPYCPKCDFIIDFEVTFKMPACGHCDWVILDSEIVHRNCFED